MQVTRPNEKESEKDASSELNMLDALRELKKAGDQRWRLSSISWIDETVPYVARAYNAYGGVQALNLLPTAWPALESLSISCVRPHLYANYLHTLGSAIQLRGIHLDRLTSLHLDWPDELELQDIVPLAQHRLSVDFDQTLALSDKVWKPWTENASHFSHVSCHYTYLLSTDGLDVLLSKPIGSLRISNYMEASKLSTFMTWISLGGDDLDQLRLRPHIMPLNVQIGCLIADPSMSDDPYAFIKDEILLKYPRVSITACSCVFYLFKAYRKTLERFANEMVKSQVKHNAFHIQIYLQQEYTDLVKELSSNNNLHSNLYNEWIRSSHKDEKCHTCPGQLIHVPLTMSLTDGTAKPVHSIQSIKPLYCTKWKDNFHYYWQHLTRALLYSH